MDDHYYMWALSECPFCLLASEVLIKEKASFSVFAMDDEPEELEALKRSRGWKTVPMIIYKDSNGKEELVGGFTDLKEWFDKLEEK
jgi:glutaredoxin